MLKLALILSLAFSIFTIKSRNQIEVLVNADDRIFINYHEIRLDQLTDSLKQMIRNVQKTEAFPEKFEKKVRHLGKVEVSKASILICNDRGTTYEVYISAQNEIERAYNELHNELSNSIFKKNFEELSKELQSSIKEVYPKRIIESEPGKCGA